MNNDHIFADRSRVRERNPNRWGPSPWEGKDRVGFTASQAADLKRIEGGPGPGRSHNGRIAAQIPVRGRYR